MIICIISIVAAQTWLLQVCQLGLHLVQHTCVHHAEGKSNEFQCPLFRFTFCNFSVHFCFHFYPSLAENRREFTICIWLPEQRPHIWSGKYLQQSKQLTFLWFMGEVRGKPFLLTKSTSICIFIWMLLHSYCGKYNWQDRQLREFLALLEPGVKIRIRALCCRQREQMTPKTPRTPEFVQINYSDFRGLQKTPLSGGEITKNCKQFRMS